MKANDVELRHLQSFLAVSETLHFGRAAERVHLSQSALSRQIQQLEQELGVLLFERLGRRVSLTPSGLTLVYHAQRVLAELAATRAAIDELAACLHGSLAIACFDSASVYFMPEVLQIFSLRHPGVDVSVATLGTQDALRSVREGDLEAAIVTLPVAADGLRVQPLYREQLVVALPLRHPLTTRRAVPIPLLGAERLITFRTTQNTRHLIDQAFAVSGTRPAGIIVLEAVEAMKNAVRCGLGLTIVGEMSVRGPARSQGLVSRPLVPPIRREIGLVMRGGSANALLTQFSQAVHDTVESVVAASEKLAPPNVASPDDASRA
ncbi:MAG: LysR family transcriptional regulator [Chloroflexota bacterium]